VLLWSGERKTMSADSDPLIPYTYSGSVEWDMEPIQTIQAATNNAADALSRSDDMTSASHS
jgi:hypothetical protein